MLIPFLSLLMPRNIESKEASLQGSAGGSMQFAGLMLLEFSHKATWGYSISDCGLQIEIEDQRTRAD